MTIRLSILAVLLFTVLAGTTSAHHNMSAVFDFNDRVTLAGTLTKLDWRNPHIEIVVSSKRDGGQVEEWRGEGPAPIWFRSRETGKAEFEKALGKAVTFEVSRARDGSRFGLLRNITLPGAKVLALCPENC